MKRFFYGMILFPVSLLTARLSALCLSTPAGVHAYELKQQTVQLDKETEETRLRLYAASTGRTVWKRTVGAVGKIGWSADHRALAAIVFLDGSFLSLLVWREGQRSHTYSLRRYGILGDNANDFVWSADRRRLLFRIGGSGSFDLNIGSLYALNVQSRRLYTISEGSVRKMEWQGSHKVRYWLAKSVSLKHSRYGDSSETVTDPKPRFWRCP